MVPSKGEEANQRKKHNAAKRSARISPRSPFTTLKHSSSLDDEIGSALSLAFAIELMGFGWESFGDDYSKALLNVSRLLIEHLNAAKEACRALREEHRKTDGAGAAS